MLTLLLLLLGTTPTNTYYYSAQQRQVLNEIAAINQEPVTHYTVVINGVKREYTECRPAGQDTQPQGRFDDYRLLGTARTQACQSW